MPHLLTFQPSTVVFVEVYLASVVLLHCASFIMLAIPWSSRSRLCRWSGRGSVVLSTFRSVNHLANDMPWNISAPHSLFIFLIITLSQTINIIIPIFVFWISFSLYIVTKILQTLCVSFKLKYIHLKFLKMSIYLGDQLTSHMTSLVTWCYSELRRWHRRNGYQNRRWHPNPAGSCSVTSDHLISDYNEWTILLI